jgi:hypothetical protein
MQHAVKHLEHVLSLGEFWAALIGAVIGGALAAWSALRAQKQAAADQRRRDEEAGRRTIEGTLRAIAAELKVLKKDSFDPLDERLKDLAQQKNRPPLQMTRTEQNRIPVFQSNAHLPGRINDDDLREQIVRVYGLIAGLLDQLKRDGGRLPALAIAWGCSGWSRRGSVRQTYRDGESPAKGFADSSGRSRSGS